MLIKERIDEIIEKAGDRSPIFFGNVHYTVLVGRKKRIKYVAELVVMKGTPEEILKSDKVKKSAALDLFKGTSDVRKKAHKFDISKINLVKVEINKFLGYGVIEGKKSGW